ncbi:MAG: hypothetical protein HUJ68_10345 [Clostridia bacterium]|nr:hypothetical protein [Clostridia bacterium]
MKLDNMEEVKILMLEMEDLFTNLDEKKKEIENEICIKEAEQEDYLHELELSKLNGIEIMQVSKELIKVRRERRKLKDKLELINTIKGYTDKYITKGIIADTRQAILNIDTLKSNQDGREYTPRIIKNLKCAKKSAGELKCKNIGVLKNIENIKKKEINEVNTEQ